MTFGVAMGVKGAIILILFTLFVNHLYCGVMVMVIELKSKFLLPK
jgi:hypothetical protein